MDETKKKIIHFAIYNYLPGMGFYGFGLIRDSSTVERVQEFRSGDSRFSGEALSHAVRLVTGLDYPLVRGVEAPARDSATRQLIAASPR